MARSRKSAYKAATELHAKLVRSRGRCEHPACETPYTAIQCAHIVSRRYAATRVRLDNAFCLCRAHHHYYTLRPLEWDRFVESMIGEDTYYRLKQAALAGIGEKMDWPVELERLRQIEREMAA